MDDQEQPVETGRTKKMVVIGLVVVVLLAAAYVLWFRPSEPAPVAPVAAPEVKAEPVAPKPEPKVEEPKPEPAPVPRRAAPKPAPPPPPAPVEPVGPTLIVESDVPGAMVFVDRQYVGTAPMKTTDVKPGSHQLNASAEGEDGVTMKIEVGETGETTVNVRFKEVRLDTSIKVVHKHGVGSCEGRLVGSPAGIRYETTNKNDAFTLTFSDLEVFEIDYMKKELKIKKRGGKTWNFTDRADNADNLFVFHRDVTKAREKLAAQGK